MIIQKEKCETFDMWLCSGGFVWGKPPGTGGSHWIVEHHVLLSQLQQHRIVEKLADAHILAQTLGGGEDNRRNEQ